MACACVCACVRAGPRQAVLSCTDTATSTNKRQLEQIQQHRNSKGTEKLNAGAWTRRARTCAPAATMPRVPGRRLETWNPPLPAARVQTRRPPARSARPPSTAQRDAELGRRTKRVHAGGGHVTAKQGLRQPAPPPRLRRREEGGFGDRA